MQSSRPVFRPYLRVSKDTTGEERSPSEQLEDLREDAEQHDIGLHERPYRDIGSASRHAKKARDAFDRMIADLRKGMLGADGIALWEGSRGSREITEWITMVDLLAENDLRVWVHTHERIFDPRKPRDRKDLLSEALDAEYESSMTSIRGKRAARREAAKGKPSGRVPFGYRREYEVRGDGKRMLVAQVEDETEGPLVRELFERIISGSTMRTIARDWAARGITTRLGNPWDQSHLRALALTPTYAGWRVHAPDMKGRRTLAMGGTRSKAMWPALVSEKDFLKMTKILTDPSRRTWRPGGARHLLSMIARCAVCRGYMTVLMKRGREVYRCRNGGHVTIPKIELEKFAVERLMAYLAREDLYGELQHSKERAGAELAKVEDDLAVAEHELAELRRRVKARELSLAFAADVEPSLLAERDRLAARRTELTVPVELSDLIEPGPDVEARWAEAEFSTQRAICKLVLARDWLGELQVETSPRRGRGAQLQPVEVVERVSFARVRS